MTTKRELETDVRIGDEIVPVRAVYTFTPVMRATECDPEDGGVVLEEVWDLSTNKQLKWTDQSWVDLLILECYEGETDGYSD